jgi:hypothetical protein
VKCNGKIIKAIPVFKCEAHIIPVKCRGNMG